MFVTSVIDVMTSCFPSSINICQNLLLIIIVCADLESVVIFIIFHDLVIKPFEIDGIAIVVGK